MRRDLAGGGGVVQPARGARGPGSRQRPHLGLMGPTSEQAFGPIHGRRPGPGGPR